MKADLHVHSTASDGTWDPGQLVAAAQAAGLGALALTDHDRIDNVEETGRLAKIAGIKFIPAVELDATKEGHDYHLLGYGVDVHNPALQELCDHNVRLLADKDDDSIRKLIARGWPLNFNEFLDYEYDPHRGGWKALAYLQDKGLCADVQDFFSRIFTAENALGFPEFPSFKEVIDIIHRAGGLALCAHIASDFHGPGLHACLPLVMAEHPDGLECFHSGHSAADTQVLLNYCREHHLCISGGSDCHGSFVKSRHLGVPEVDTADLYLPGWL